MMLDRIHKTLILIAIVVACLLVVPLYICNQFPHRFVAIGFQAIDHPLPVLVVFRCPRLQNTGAKVIVRLVISLGSHHAISRLRLPILDHLHVLVVALVIALQEHILISTFRKHT